MAYEYVTEFENKAFGMFVHFGLFSVVGKGEWAKKVYEIPNAEYEKNIQKFKVKKNWAKDLVRTAKKAGCKYITLTTRHHEGFSLFDTCGLNEYDAPHSPTGRDLIREFVDECRKQDIQPFFYLTLFDWFTDYADNDFEKNIDYVCQSLEILCKNYGKIGGFWFDGVWRYKTADWQEDRIYAVIRKYQPDAMIINNTGMGKQGHVGHPEIDSVTFERGAPKPADCGGRKRAGELCQVLNDHWGYAQNDVSYKSLKTIIENLVDCRINNCNMLLNVGPKGDGSLRNIDKAMLEEIGKWVKLNKNFIYKIRRVEDIKAENAQIVKDDKYYYAIIKDVPMKADPDVAIGGNIKEVFIDAKIKDAVWLDNGEKIKVKEGRFIGRPFYYGNSLYVRVARFKIAK